jgi:HlyD family secretion protein
MKPELKIVVVTALLAACSGNSDEADAYGTFEAREVTVSAETGGRILEFGVTEGSVVEKGMKIALIDTTLFHLQKAEIDAGMRSIRTRISSVNAQNEILDQQIANLNVNIERIANMLKNDAATQKQYDDLKGQVAVLEKQIAANNTQRASIAAELSVYESKKATLREQTERSCVRSPLEGTILENMRKRRSHCSRQTSGKNCRPFTHQT